MRWFVIALFAALGTKAAGPAGTEVGFDFLHNQVVLQAMIQGQGPYNFVLDTGTMTSTIDLELARRLHLTLGAPRVIAGAGTSQRTGRRTTLPEMAIGGLKVQAVEAAAIDLSAMSDALGRPLGGVLGFSLLKDRVVQIDYFQRRIRFSNESASLIAAGKGFTFPMVFHEGSVLPVIQDCYVNGSRASITLDTGSSLGLVLFPGAVEKLRLSEIATSGAPLRADGYLGKAHLTRGWVTSLKIGPHDLGAVEAAFVQRGYGETGPSVWRDGSLGNAVLQDFVLTLDYRARTVTFEAPDE
jgi:hypothetical protein